jgi:small-conductance mechanosensitive channel
LLPLLISIGVLSAAWFVAHILATITLNLVRGARPWKILIQVLNRDGEEDVRPQSLRPFIFILLIVAVGFALTFAVGFEPLQNAWFGRVTSFAFDERTQSVVATFLDYLLLTLGITVTVQLISIFNRIFPRLREIIDDWRYTRFRVIRIQSLELITPDQLTDLILLLIGYTRLGLNLLVGLVGLTFLFSFFPGTEGLIQGLSERAVDYFNTLWADFLAFLPDLFNLIVIAVVTRYTLKALHFFSEGFRKGKIRLKGFHPELAQPTYQIVRFLVIALAIVAAFPYIPGSDSPVFRGISIFVGFLVSLGSTSLVTNIISGVVLTYSRGLRIGDRVQIGDTVGDVVERSLLVTRVRTIKNVEVTIPNGMVLGNHIINYSTAAEERGLILNTTVTIGYDVPWKKVHDLLIAAALSTHDIMSFPEPFVLQTSLDDYYVSYELNAYTMKPNKMALIYSDLHQKIQDYFNEAEVEILSPSYSAVRDGHQSSIPKEYLPNNYRAPGFRTYPVKRGRITEPLRHQ